MAKRKLTAEERAKVFKALSDPRRVDIVDAIAKDGARSGTELADQLGISLALLCHHWEVLVDAGILKKERVGQARICTFDSERIEDAAGPWRTSEAKDAPARATRKKRAKTAKATKARSRK